MIFILPSVYSHSSKLFVDNDHIFQRDSKFLQIWLFHSFELFKGEDLVLFQQRKVLDHTHNLEEILYILSISFIFIVLTLWWLHKLLCELFDFLFDFLVVLSGDFRTISSKSRSFLDNFLVLVLVEVELFHFLFQFKLLVFHLLEFSDFLELFFLW